MRILLTGTSFRSSYGGPAYSVSGLANALASAGVSVGVWAADGSATITPLLLENCNLKRMAGNATDVLSAFKAEVVHDNGLWLAHNHRIARVATVQEIPRVVSVRGMLEPWALAHKRWKKKAAWWIYQQRDLRHAACHHATAGSEEENVARFRLGAPIVVIPNGVETARLPNSVSRTRDRVGIEGERVALFLSRIHPKKGLPMLIQAWKRQAPVGWSLRIAGPDEAGHQAEVERLIAEAGLTHQVFLVGPLVGEAKAKAFAEADLFVLPTHSENFGIVVAEALAHGVPVLTTTGAPWSMLPERGCGWWVAPTADGIAQGLREATSRSSEELRVMGEKGRQFVASEFGWDGIAKQFISLYEGLLRAR